MATENNERLYIRLPLADHEPVFWAILATDALIASGELNSPSELSQLSERAASREVVCFVSSKAVSLRQVTVPSGNSRHMTRNLSRIVPFALEDELASDIDDLHFAWPPKAKTSPLPVAVVAHSQMQTWQGWLTDAHIKCNQLIPDVFAMPYQPNAWQAMYFGYDRIVRTGPWSGFTVEASLFQHVANPMVAELLAQQGAPAHILHYGEFEW